MKMFYYFLLFSTVLINAQTYYISNVGNDSNSGKSADSAWQTIKKLNSVMNSIQPGAAIYFRRGDSFVGQIQLTQSGKPGLPITFDAYGFGDNPIISGAQQINNWVKVNGNIWKSTGVAPKTTMMFQQNRILTPARYPNNGFLRISSNGTKTSFTDNTLSFPDNYFDSAFVATQPVDWQWDRAIVYSSKASGLIVHSGNEYEAEKGMGFFFYGKPEFIDAENEWAQDPLTGNIFIYSLADPNNVSFSISSNSFGIKGDWNRNNIVVRNLNFFGQVENAIWLMGAGCENNTIENCYFTNIYKTAITIMGNNINVTDCIFEDIYGHGIFGYNTSNSKISHCDFNKIGLILGHGNSGVGDLQAIVLNTGSNNVVSENIIDSTGYSGMTCNIENSLIEKNIISNSLLTTADGGAFYCYGTSSKNTVISRNFIDVAVGNISARPPNTNFIVNGIYLDNHTSNITVVENTVTNITAGAAIVVNAGTNNHKVVGNTLYGNLYGVFLSDWLPGNTVVGNIVTHNKLITRNKSQVPMIFASDDNNYSMASISDSNSFVIPYDTIAVKQLWSNPKNFSLKAWQTETKYDLNSIASNYRWVEGTDSSFIIKNTTNNALSLKFENARTAIGVPLDTVTIQPYTSIVLIGSQKTLHSETDIEHQTPQQLGLLGNFPNPFNPSTTITFFVPNKTTLNITIYDATGSKIETLAEQEFEQGTQTIHFDAKYLATGVYFAVLKSDNVVITQKMLLIK